MVIASLFTFLPKFFCTPKEDGIELRNTRARSLTSRHEAVFTFIVNGCVKTPCQCPYSSRPGV